MNSKNNDILRIYHQRAAGTIVIFDNKDLYECYGDDALLIANDVLMSDAMLKRDNLNGTEIHCITFNQTQFGRVIKDLILLFRYRVELYEEIDGKFKCEKKGSLGSLMDFEDIVSSGDELAELSTIMCARLIGDDLSLQNRVCLTFCNSQDMRIVTAEFQDSAHFSLFEQCVVALNPRECVVLEKDALLAPQRFKQLDVALQRTNLQKSIISSGNLSADLFKYPEKYRPDCVGILKSKFKDAHLNDHLIQGMWVLLNHMQLLDDPKSRDSFQLLNYGSCGYMYISNSTLQALEVFSVSSDFESSSLGCAQTLFDHLNRCRTQCGRRMLREWMRRPLFDLRRIKERCDVVEGLFQKNQVRMNLNENLLRRVPDIDFLTRRFLQSKATLQDCYRIYQFIDTLEGYVKNFKEIVEDYPSLEPSITELILQPIQHSRLECERFQVLVESTLDTDHYESSGEFRINPEVDPTLEELASTMKDVEKKARRILQETTSKYDCEGAKLETNKDFGYCFRVTIKNEKAIRDIKSIKVIDSSKGGGIRFQTKSLEILNEEFRDLISKYETAQSDLTKAVLTTCATFVPALNNLSERIGIIDVLTSFAMVASQSSTPYVRAEILDKGTNAFELIECRHPIIEVAPGMQYIPNDVSLVSSSSSEGGHTTPQRQFAVLTGANMGGKSTYLRAAALTVFLGQIGSFVPCTSAKFSLIDGIFTRVGAGDFQFKGVSTFMAEMMDCATILETATTNSLIIIDELGRGTSTYDGFGLAWAIAEEIINRIKCYCLFATHFHKLAIRLGQFYPESVENLKMETIVEDGQTMGIHGKLTILYQVTKGVADRSFGLNIARMVGFPEEIIKNAAKELELLEIN